MDLLSTLQFNHGVAALDDIGTLFLGLSWVLLAMSIMVARQKSPRQSSPLLAVSAIFGATVSLLVVALRCGLLYPPEYMALFILAIALTPMPILAYRYGQWRRQSAEPRS